MAVYVAGGASSLTPKDFEAIQDAVMETPRGRWFLSEYANRLKTSETVTMLDSMKRLETAVASNHDALMGRLAEALARQPGQGTAPAPQTDIAPKHLKFFKQDEEVFVPAPQAAISAAKEPPKPEVPRGAKLIIRRASGTAAADAAPVAPVSVAPAPVADAPPPAANPVAALAFEAAQADAPPKRRIVIIRHKPGAEIDVPLQNELAQAS